MDVRGIRYVHAVATKKWSSAAISRHVLLIAVMLCTPLLVSAQKPDLLWTGQIQCTLTMQLPGYSHQETQTWKLTGEPPKMTGEIAVYPATWSVAGSGTGQRTVNAQFTSSQWKSAVVPVSAPIAMFVRINGLLVIKTFHSQLSSPKSTTITRQVALLGANPTSATVQYATDEWLMPTIEDASSSTSISGAGTMIVGGTSIPERPGGTSQSANCTWQFNRSSGVQAATVTLPPAPPTHLTLNSPPPPASGTQTSSNSSAGSSSGGPASQRSSQASAAGPQMLAPQATPGPGQVVLSWTPPTDASTPTVDSYEIEVDSGGASSTLNINAPNNSYTYIARACPDSNPSCSTGSWKTYRFHIRAHNSVGYGPYSDYTASVRPFLSYMEDISQFWNKLQCTSCHTRQAGSSPLFLDDAPAGTYNNIRSTANVIGNPDYTSRLLTYPSHQAGHCGSLPNLFTPKSFEFSMVRQWIADGQQF